MSDLELDVDSKAEGISVMAAASSAKTRKMLKPVSPSASRKRQDWVSAFMTEDKVTSEWRRTGVRKLKDGSSAVTYKCAIGGLKCDARLKKVVGVDELSYFSNGKDHNNHLDNGEVENDTPVKKRNKKKAEKKVEVEDSDSDSESNTKAVKQGMSNMVKKYVKSKSKKRARISSDGDDEATEVDSDNGGKGDSKSNTSSKSKKPRKSESGHDRKKDSDKEKKRKSAKVKLVIPMP